MRSDAGLGAGAAGAGPTTLSFGDEPAVYGCLPGTDPPGGGRASFLVFCAATGTLAGLEGPSCVDRNECVTGTATCAQICINTVGSFQCDCRPGYALDADQQRCKDIDECTNNQPGCAQRCVNTVGSYQCQCNAGFELVSRTECTRVACGAPPLFVEQGGAVTTRLTTAADVLDQLVFEDAVSYTCLPGHEAGGGKTFEAVCTATGALRASTGGLLAAQCTDINECASEHECHQVCTNTPGGYECGCRAGFLLGQDRRSCVDVVTLRGNGTQPRPQVNGDAYFDGQTGVALPSDFVLQATGLTLQATFKLARHSDGYVLAKTDVQGNTRHLALYLHRTAQATLYFRTAGGQASVRFQLPVVVNDARWHTLVLVVGAGLAILRVDRYYSGVQLLPGPIADAPSALMFVGMRSDGPGQTAYHVQGFVRNVQLYLRRLLPAPPVPAAPELMASDPTAVQVLVAGPARQFAGNAPWQPPAYAAAPHPSTGRFSLVLTVLQAPGTAGYLLAKTDASGARRFYSLYADGAGLRLYFAERGSAQLRLRRWPEPVNDGLYHRVVVAFDGLDVSLRVDGRLASAVAPLDALVDDCGQPSADCVLLVGGRAAATGSALELTGAVAYAAIYAGVALPFDPQPRAPPMPLPDLPQDGEHPYLDLLDNSQHEYVGTVPRDSSGLLVTDGLSNGVRLTAHSFWLEPNFTLAVTARIAPGDSGYLVAKTDGSGRHRYLALYVSAARSRLTMYYGSPVLGRLAANFNAGPLFDGRMHHLLLSVRQLNATVRVDDRVVGSVALLAHVQDCGAADAQTCVLNLGQRASGTGSGAHRLAVTWAQARLYPQHTLDVSPRPPASGAHNFVRLADRYISGRNQGGSFGSGVPADECARRCLALPRCRSFDAGRPDSSAAGACYLSFDSRATLGAAALSSSTVLDYYERRWV